MMIFGALFIVVALVALAYAEVNLLCLRTG